MTKTQMEVTVGRTNSGRFFFEIIDGDRLVARVVNFDTAEQAEAAANDQVEALSASPDIAALNRNVLAQIASTFAAPLKATDSRIEYCERLAVSLQTEITGYGMAGAAQVFVSLMSAGHWRMKRAQFLALHCRSARDGWPKPAIMWMRKAIEARREEQFCAGRNALTLSPATQSQAA